MYSSDVIAFSVNNLIVNICSITIVFCRLADWPVRICCCVCPFILFGIHIAWTYIKKDSSIIGLTFVRGLFSH